MGYQWVATSMLTGELICDLKGLICTNPQQTIGQYESCTATLPIPTAPPGWQLAVTPGASVIWLLVDAPNGGTVPVWGGYVSACTLDHSDNAQLTLATLETYLSRRYTGTRTYTNEDGNLICQDLIQNCIATGPQGGLPIRVNIVGGAGQPQTISWLDQNDVTVYDALQSLTALMGGPEWFISGEWQHNPERITPVFNVGGRLGTPQTPGLTPPVVFDMPGNLAGFSALRSFAQDLGANSVMAYSTGSGTVRPQSPYENQADPIRPTFEYRWSPSQNILSVSQLDEWAKAALGILSVGSVSLTGAVKLGPGVVYGVDWQLGDDIGYQIGAPVQPQVIGTRRNWLLDPSFESLPSTAYWVPFTSTTITADTTMAHSGSQSAKVTTTAAGGGIAGSWNNSTTPSPAVSSSGGVWVWTPAGVQVTVQLAEYAATTPTLIGTSPKNMITGTGTWQFATTPAYTKQRATSRLRLNVNSVTTATFWVDDAIIEAVPNVGPAFNGNTAGTGTDVYTWDGTPGASTSTDTQWSTGQPASAPAFPNGLSGVARVIGFVYTVGNTMSMQVLLAGGTLLQFDVEQALNLFVNSTILTVGTA